MRKFLLVINSKIVYLLMSVFPEPVSSKINSTSFTTLPAMKQHGVKRKRLNSSSPEEQHNVVSNLHVSLEAFRNQFSQSVDESSLKRIPESIKNFFTPYCKLVQSIDDMFYCMNNLFACNANLVKGHVLADRLRYIAERSRCDLKNLTDDLIIELKLNCEGDTSVLSLIDSDSDNENQPKKLPDLKNEIASSGVKEQAVDAFSNDIEFTDSDIDLELDEVVNKVCEKEYSAKRIENERCENKFSFDPSNIPLIKEKKTCPQNLKFDPDGFLVVYIDGSCWSNGRKNAKAGLGVWFNEQHPLNVSKPVKGAPTNNNAEIQAASEAIRQAESIGVKNLRIFTDSMFLINCMTQWIHKWKMNDWKTSSKENVKNKDSLMELDKLMPLMQRVDWQYVEGHRGILGNERADALAKKGAKQYRIS